MLSLSSLLEKNPIVFYEFVILCRDSAHRLFCSTGELLRDLKLIEQDGQPHDAIRLVVLAAIEGDKLEMKLVSPVIEEEKPQQATEKKRKLDDFELYTLIRHIADLILSYANKGTENGRIWVEDRRKEGSNPYYNQTADGLFLEFYYGHPSKLWTPWGEWEFTGSGSGNWEPFLPEILERLGAELHEPERHSKMGVFGPVYALRKVDDTVLPDPIALDNKAYDSYEDVNKAWKKLTEKYREVV